MTAPVYAAWAAIGLPPPAVATRLARFADDHARRGFGAIPELVEASAMAAARFAALMGVDPAGVARTGSTSEGIVAVAHMTPWRTGDRVVLFGGEFPTNRTPWLRAAAHHGLDVVDVPADAFVDPDQGLAALDTALACGARLVAVSAVQFQTGLRMPIDEILDRAHAAGAQVCVDAIQAAGVVPLDLARADWVAVGGHKWLGMPVGTGFLAGTAAAWSQAGPAVASWLSHPDPFAFLTRPDARPAEDAFVAGPALVEGGMRNHPGLAAGVAALDAHLAGDRAARFAALQAVHDRIEGALADTGLRSLRAADSRGRSGILSFALPDGIDAEALAAAIARAGAIVTVPEGLLRLSPGVDTTADDADRLAQAVRDGLRAVG